MVLCSKAAVGTCCTEDRTGHPAWKYSRTNVFAGNSCADARISFCKSRGTYGTKYCPGSRQAIIQARQPGPAARVTPQTDPYRSPRSAIRTPAKVVYPRPVQYTLQSRGSTLRAQQRLIESCDFPSGASAPSGEGGSTPHGTPDTEQPPSTAPSEKAASAIEKFCPYFKWMSFMSEDCNVQVIAGAAIVVLGGALLFRVLK